MAKPVSGTLIPLGSKRVARFIVGTTQSGWTKFDCDYLCDGVADDVEINAAIQALPVGGGEIIILDGLYNIEAEIEISKSNVSIKGNGNATTLKRMWDSSTAEGVITLREANECRIENLQIDGNRATYVSTKNFGILLYTSSNNTITGNTCNNNSYAGILLCHSSINNIMIGNTCNNNYIGGFLLQTSSGNNTITGNTCNNTYPGDGINLHTSSNNTITGNTCNNNDVGLRLHTSSNNTITGNTCNNNGIGINIQAYSDNNAIIGNTLNNNNIGIFLSNSRNNNITGNTCIRGTGIEEDYTFSQHTIYISNLSLGGYNLISNNNCMGKAPLVEGDVGNTLVNNKYE